MTIIENLEECVNLKDPLVLTIGNFDGMHRGHCALLKHAKSLMSQEGEVLVLTFRNHPSEVLKPEQPIPLLCSLTHKLRLLEQNGIDNILLLSFTRYLAQHSAYSFIENIRQFIPFSHLVLGHDATLGRDRQGNYAIMQELGMEWGFNVHYLKEYRYEGKGVSSTRIRETLQQGNLDLVEALLDRPYSILGHLNSVKEKEKRLDFPTAHVEITGLCLPPFGIYAIDVLYDSKRHQGIANLSSNIQKEDNHPILEVFLFDSEENWLNREAEVVFKGFIRPEQEFQNRDDLEKQILNDIDFAKRHSFHFL